jgi:transposase
VKNKLILLLSFFVLLSCGENKLSEDILDEDKMVEVLVDIHMTEGLVSTFPIHYDSSRLLYPYFETEIFKKHGITDSVFKKSLEFYLRDIRVMDRIYARTIDSLHVKEKSRIE